MRPTKDQWAMALVAETAKRSTCCRRQVGCVLLNEHGHALSTGYNGVAAGLPHCNELRPGTDDWQEMEGDLCYPSACPGWNSPSGTNLDGCQAIHAEQNALLQCFDVYKIHTCYVSCFPCLTCVKLLLNTQCERIVFCEDYAHQKAKELWTNSGRLMLKL